LKLSALALADRSVQIDGPARKVSDSRWYGYVVGHWEGDSFVVNSNNFNDATWLDQYGSPHSDQMIVEERYHRLDHDHLEMINDLPANICAFSEVKLHGKAWQQIHL
jgi:hypothetical protein